MENKNPQNEEPNDTDREIEYYPDNAVVKELKAVPERHRDRFLLSLSLLAKGLKPTCDVKQLDSIDRNIYELIINGRPAWRCIYYTGDSGKIVVMHATKKTTNGSDRQIANVVEQRLKAWRGLKKQGGKAKAA